MYVLHRNHPRLYNIGEGGGGAAVSRAGVREGCARAAAAAAATSAHELPREWRPPAQKQHVGGRRSADATAAPAPPQRPPSALSVPRAPNRGGDAIGALGQRAIKILQNINESIYNVYSLILTGIRSAGSFAIAAATKRATTRRRWRRSTRLAQGAGPSAQMTGPSAQGAGPSAQGTGPSPALLTHTWHRCALSLSHTPAADAAGCRRGGGGAVLIHRHSQLPRSSRAHRGCRPAGTGRRALLTPPPDGYHGRAAGWAARLFETRVPRSPRGHPEVTRRSQEA